MHWENASETPAVGIVPETSRFDVYSVTPAFTLAAIGTDAVSIVIAPANAHAASFNAYLFIISSKWNLICYKSVTNYNKGLRTCQHFNTYFC